MINSIVAETILQQLGWNRFIAMTGAKDFVADTNSLRFKIPRNGSKANYCKITLEPTDLYTVEFIKFTPSRFYSKTMKYTEPKWETLQTYEGIDAQHLTSVFEQYTKMYTSL